MAFPPVSAYLLDFFAERRTSIRKVLKQIAPTARCTYCPDPHDCDGFHNTIPPSLDRQSDSVVFYVRPMDREVRVESVYMCKGEKKYTDFHYIHNLPHVRTSNVTSHVIYSMADIIKYTLCTAQPPHPGRFGLEDPRIAFYSLASTDPMIVTLHYR